MPTASARSRTSLPGRALARSARILVASLCIVARPAVADDVLLFAAASLTDVLRELGGSYEHRTHDQVSFNFGASSDLARQMKAGAPADAFFSADVARMDELEAAGLVDRSERRSILSNTLAIVVPAGAATQITAPADLTKLRTIALADPEVVPAGVYARSYLQRVGLWPAIEHAVVPTLDVRAALAAVEAERADAGIVYATDAATSKRARVALRIPREQGPAIVYALAPLKRSTKPASRALVRFLASREAAPTYERYGFTVLATE